VSLGPGLSEELLWLSRVQSWRADSFDTFEKHASAPTAASSPPPRAKREGTIILTIILTITVIVIVILLLTVIGAGLILESG
ncbi:MAG: hypothetical protein M3291_09730, partial [Actinomycetota bacterium]|nr:hypothetical protein [Actinomycetota bacterium]